MTTEHWQGLLARCNELLLAWQDLTARTGCEIPASRYFGFPPATEAEITKVERRLGVIFPPSLRSFYRVSNGWMVVGCFIWKVRPVEEVGWLRDVDPSLFTLVEQFRTSRRSTGKVSDDIGEEAEHIHRESVAVARSLVISSEGDASTWLVDPFAPDDRGEWRGSRWSSWNPETDWSAKDFVELFSSEVDFLEEILLEERG